MDFLGIAREALLATFYLIALLATVLLFLGCVRPLVGAVAESVLGDKPMPGKRVAALVAAMTFLLWALIALCMSVHPAFNGDADDHEAMKQRIEVLKRQIEAEAPHLLTQLPTTND